MSATPADTARRLVQFAGARAIYLEEKAKREVSGRPTPPADPQARWIETPKGTRAVDDDSRLGRRRRRERAQRALIRREHGEVPAIARGPNRTCGNCGDPVKRYNKGRCKTCYNYVVTHACERSVTPRYGASKL